MSATLDELRAQADALVSNARQLVTQADSHAAALRDYNPAPPPTPTVSPVRFARFLHEQDKTYSIATQQERWRLQVIQGDPWHLEQMRALVAGGTLALRYATPVTRRTTDPDGDSTCLPPGQIPDAWMLRDTAGNIITRPRDGDQFVDVGNLAYQKAAGTCLADRCKREGWPGVWIDEVNPDPRDSFKNNGQLPPGYATPARYQAAIRGFVNAVGAALRGAGLQVWINLAGDYDDAWTNGLARETDGATIEFFLARYPYETGSVSNGYFGEALNWVTRREAEGKPGMYHAQTTDPALARYALAGYLLATKGGAGYFSAGVDGYPVSGTVWTPDMENARKLGQPVGTYRVSGGLYVRDFEHGTVTANPGRSAVGGLAATSATITLR